MLSQGSLSPPWGAPSRGTQSWHPSVAQPGDCRVPACRCRTLGDILGLCEEARGQKGQDPEKETLEGERQGEEKGQCLPAAGQPCTHQHALSCLLTLLTLPPMVRALTCMPGGGCRVGHGTQGPLCPGDSGWEGPGAAPGLWQSSAARGIQPIRVCIHPPGTSSPGPAREVSRVRPRVPAMCSCRPHGAGVHPCLVGSHVQPHTGWMQGQRDPARVPCEGGRGWWC